MNSQDTKWHRNIAENCNHLSRAHERYRRHTDDRQTTDARPMTYSERELEFTLANKTKPDVFVIYTSLAVFYASLVKIGPPVAEL